MRERTECRYQSRNVAKALGILVMSEDCVFSPRSGYINTFCASDLSLSLTITYLVFSKNLKSSSCEALFLKNLRLFWHVERSRASKNILSLSHEPSGFKHWETVAHVWRCLAVFRNARTRHPYYDLGKRLRYKVFLCFLSFSHTNFRLSLQNENAFNICESVLRKEGKRGSCVDILQSPKC